LKSKLREAGLPVSGNKAILVERLEQNEVEDDEEEVEDDEEEVEEDEEKDEKKALPSKPATAGDSIYAIGDAVEGYFEEEDTWYAAKVVKDNGKGRFTIAWEEDDEEFLCQPTYIRKKASEVDRFGPFVPGEMVEALSDEDESYYAGIIQRDNGDGTFMLLWWEDGSEYTCKADAMKKIVPDLEVEELKPGMKFKGTVQSVQNYGLFVKFGCVRDGLVHVSRIPPREAPKEGEKSYRVGDRVEAVYEDELEWYMGTVESVNDDGTYTLRWDDDDGETYDAKEEDIMEVSSAQHQIGDEVTVWVQQVVDGKVSLTMMEGDVARPGMQDSGRRADMSEFQDVSPDEWLTGKVVSILPFGCFVEIKSAKGNLAQGLVHVSRMTDGYVEDPNDYVKPRQQVQVRIEEVDVQRGRMSLSMK